MGKGNDPNCAQLAAAGAMSDLLEPVAAYSGSRRTPDGLVCTPGLAPRPMSGQLSGNWQTETKAQKAGVTAMQKWAEKSDSNHTRGGAGETDLLTSLTGGEPVAEQPADKPREHAGRTQVKTRRPSMTQYRALSTALSSVLLSEFPVVSVPRTGLTSARDYSSLVEKSWLDTVPDDYAVDTPDHGTFRLVKAPSDKYWYDFGFAQDDHGLFMPVNFKTGTGTSSDNLCGLQGARYMLEGDVREGHPFFQMPVTHDTDLANLVYDLMTKKRKINKSSRDYFVLHYNHETGEAAMIPALAMLGDRLKGNPSAGLQITSLASAECDISRPVEESVQTILNANMEYYGKRTASGGRASGIMGPEGSDDKLHIAALRSVNRTLLDDATDDDRREIAALEGDRAALMAKFMLLAGEKTVREAADLIGFF